MRIQFQSILFFGLLALAGCSQTKSTQDLIDDLKSTDNEDRIKAVRLLQHRHSDASIVVPALMESLSDDDREIRWSAAIGLGYFGADAEGAVPELETAQQHDSDRRVREAARTAISRIRN